jgi:hypothetical protein
MFIPPLTNTTMFGKHPSPFCCDRICLSNWLQGTRSSFRSQSWFCGTQQLISASTKFFESYFWLFQSIKITVFRNVTPYSPIDGYRWLRASSGGRWISREGRNAVGIEEETQAGTGQLRAPTSVIYISLSLYPCHSSTCLAYSSAPETEATSSPETSVYTYQTTRSHIPDDRALHSHYCQNPIWHTSIQFTFLCPIY